MHLSVNGAVYANGIRLGNRGPGCIRLVKSTIHYQEPVKDRVAMFSACCGSHKSSWACAFTFGMNSSELWLGRAGIETSGKIGPW